MNTGDTGVCGLANDFTVLLCEQKFVVKQERNPSNKVHRILLKKNECRFKKPKSVCLC